MSSDPRRESGDPETKVFAVAVSLWLFGCALNSGVVPIGPDTFMVSRQAATGFSGSGTLKADALREGHQYCSSQKKVMQVTHTSEATPPFVFGNFPKAEGQFMFLDAGDAELARPKMRKEPHTVFVKVPGRPNWYNHQNRA